MGCLSWGVILVRRNSEIIQGAKALVGMSEGVVR